MQRLTDIWQNLLGTAAGEAGTAARERERLDRMERVSEAFHNMYWTRIRAVDAEADEESERHGMAADIIEAWNEIEEASELLGLTHQVHYDPRQFAAENPDATKEEFALPAEELRNWGNRCSSVRASIIRKSHEQKDDPPSDEAQPTCGRSRKGLKLSRPSCNVDGLSERQLREQRLAETVPGRHYRARRRKDVSLQEQEEIV